MVFEKSISYGEWKEMNCTWGCQKYGGWGREKTPLLFVKEKSFDNSKFDNAVQTQFYYVKSEWVWSKVLVPVKDKTEKHWQATFCASQTERKQDSAF